jgi:hypothetical protein
MYSVVCEDKSLNHIVSEGCFDINIDYSAQPNYPAFEDVRSALDCQEHCFRQSSCKFFTLNLDTGKCWLKPSMGKKINTIGSASAVSGPKECRESKYHKHCNSKYKGRCFTKCRCFDCFCWVCINLLHPVIVYCIYSETNSSNRTLLCNCDQYFLKILVLVFLFKQ